MAADGAAGLVLYDYWRSSASYRVRIALNLKGLAYEQRPVHLVRSGGEQHQDAYRRVNPQGLVPALVHGDRVLTQSLAICEYLDEAFGGPALLDGDAGRRARIRALAQAVACDIHPINNLRVLKYLGDELGQGEDAVRRWYAHWITLGFAAVERTLASREERSPFCFGEAPSLADCCLVPQVYNAERFACDLEPYPELMRVVAHCRALDAFEAAQPEFQPDAPDR